ncbi:hypothetical protein VCEM1676A_003163 [Vibrio cholerae O1 str. EM-1676A]|nr:hypothetical protein VCEM1676A_003163 [Vibrio cholerae O1 str. EM-1676A]
MRCSPLNAALAVFISLELYLKYKHVHGTKNPVIEQEEKAILLAVDRALASSSNSQTIGRNGELPLLEFFNRYLPPTFKAVSGHFITPNGNISPQIDIMILDTRFPLLAENLDGSVLAMLHAVVDTIEVKTNLTSSDLKKIGNDISKIRDLMNEVVEFKDLDSWKAPITSVIAYRIKNKIDTIESAFVRICEPECYHFDLSVLRFSDKDMRSSDVGCDLHFEPNSDSDVKSLKMEYGIPDSAFKGNFMLTTRPSYTPLSDIYYRLVQNGYYILGSRNFGFNDIGMLIMEYMSWSTASWEDLYAQNG